MDTDKIIRELKAVEEKEKGKKRFTFETCVDEMAHDCRIKIEELAEENARLESELKKYSDAEKEGRLLPDMQAFKERCEDATENIHHHSPVLAEIILQKDIPFFIKQIDFYKRAENEGRIIPEIPEQIYFKWDDKIYKSRVEGRDKKKFYWYADIITEEPGRRTIFGHSLGDDWFLDRASAEAAIQEKEK